jgi:predicted aminopeptidase
LPLALCAALVSCSPVYVTKVVIGHTKLLWHRKDIDKALKDPKTPPALKSKLEIVQAARAFAFDHMSLRRSRKFSTYSAVNGPFVTYLLEASEKLRFKPYIWYFPLVGSFPYKGYFNMEDAKSEAASFKARGYDTYIGGVGAYNTTLWLSDPVPSTALDYATGELADLIIHELTHSTIWYRDQTDFNESMAVFMGGEGAKQFLTERFGADSAEMKDYIKAKSDEESFTNEMNRLYIDLDSVYTSSATDSVKLARREEIFADGLKRVNALGFEFKKLNNALVLADRGYHLDLSLFEKAYEAQGRDWAKTVVFLKTLDKRDPYGDLKRRVEAQK